MTGIFIFKLILGQVVFSLTFPWTGWFRKLPVLGQVAIVIFAYQFKVFGCGRAKTLWKNQPWLRVPLLHLPTLLLWPI
jgi:hypothetical protein